MLAVIRQADDSVANNEGDWAKTNANSICNHDAIILLLLLLINASGRH